MVIPVGRQYTATCGATVARPFRCEHCGFAARAIAHGQGRGRGISPFFIDEGGAKTDAKVKARFTAREHARFTLDVVPCPRCHKRSARAEEKFRRKTTVVLNGSIVLGAGTAALIGVAAKAPIPGLLIGGFATGLAILVDAVTRKADWTSASERVVFEEPGSDRSESQRHSSSEGERGEDVRVDAKLSLANAMTGGKVELMVRGKVPCPGCRGTGVWAGDPCQACSAGTLERQRRVLVKFPAGIDSGHRLRVAGLGMPGLDDVPPGDLYVNVEVVPERPFQRRGDDLETLVRVSSAIAALGGQADIELPDGSSVTAHILPGTESGARLTIVGKGMPRLGQPGHGDLHVVVEIGS